MQVIKPRLCVFLAVIFASHASNNHENNQNIFSDYENCINLKVRLLNQNLGKPTPQAMLAQIGDDIRMTCDTW